MHAYLLTVRWHEPRHCGCEKEHCPHAPAPPAPRVSPPPPPPLCQVRPGVLPRMLREILDTRVMIKGAMKKVAAADKVRHTSIGGRVRACVWGTDQL